MGDQTIAQLQYLDNDADLAVYIASTGGGEVIPHEGNYSYKDIAIINGREVDKEFDLNREGFRLISHASRVNDFYSDADIREVYEQEIRGLVTREAGATTVEVFDHTRRTSSETLRQEKKIREPASIIHNDYTENSALKRLKTLYPKHAETLGDKRFAIVNVWRSINGEVLNHALCMCDASSVVSKDLVPVVRKAKDRLGEIQLATHNPSHRWYFFPLMNESEVMMFKTYDSATDGRARYTIHTAFDDPDALEDCRPRESIETRCFVFF